MDEKLIREKIAEKLHDLIEETGKGWTRIAEEIGLNEATINNILHMRCFPSLVSMVKIAEYFEVTTDWLLGLREERVKIAKPRMAAPRGLDSSEIISSFNQAWNYGAQIKILAQLHATIPDVILGVLQDEKHRLTNAARQALDDYCQGKKRPARLIVH